MTRVNHPSARKARTYIIHPNLGLNPPQNYRYFMSNIKKINKTDLTQNANRIAMVIECERRMTIVTDAPGSFFSFAFPHPCVASVHMAAAVIGSRNRGQLIKAEQELARRAQENELKRQQREVAQSIMEKYDKDSSGALSPKELKRMLRDYSQHRFKIEVQPSAEDLIFLFRLFDTKPDGVIDRDEIMGIVGAWGEFMKQKQLVQNLAQKFDKDSDNQIDLAELQDILDATNRRPVNSQITQWVMREADVSGNGLLSSLAGVRWSAYLAG
ncbi:CMD1 [Symbiodinium natans]|uniref:CMD1 protein n=1 Tax=Symbiodinium natans TaxID=878477 RepID=A0A812KMZ2_9DINO|nr:CMD1 [Symbiodinium natans]